MTRRCPCCPWTLGPCCHAIGDQPEDPGGAVADDGGGEQGLDGTGRRRVAAVASQPVPAAVPGDGGLALCGGRAVPASRKSRLVSACS